MVSAYENAHLLPSDLRRASRRFFSSMSLVTRIDLTAGKADCALSVSSHAEARMFALTLRRFPLLSLSAEGFSSRVESPLGPMLLLRVLPLRDFFGEGAEGSLKDKPVPSPSAMFSLASSLAMLEALRGVEVVVLVQSRLASDEKRLVNKHDGPCTGGRSPCHLTRTGKKIALVHRIILKKQFAVSISFNKGHAYAHNWGGHF